MSTPGDDCGQQRPPEGQPQGQSPQAPIGPPPSRFGTPNTQWLPPRQGGAGMPQGGFGPGGYGPAAHGQGGFGSAGQAGFGQLGQPAPQRPQGAPGYGIPVPQQRPPQSIPPQGMPPRPNQVPGAPRPAGFTPPPPRFREERAENPLERLRAKQAEAAKDAELAEAPKERSFRPWMAWTLAGVAGAVALALVLGITLGSAPTTPPPQAAGTSGPAATPTAPATSTFQPPTPVAAAPGALIPITQDVQFAQGISFVAPTVTTGWTENTELTTRDPNGIALKDSAGMNAITFTHSTLDSKHYRDEDLTRSALLSAPQSFVNQPDLVGEPVSYTLQGSGGYQLELLAQKMQWGGWAGGQDAYVITRYMPQSDARVEIVVLCPTGDFDNPNSKIRKKLAEISFTTP